ncbi:PREDICTED: acetolactate synthase-like protein [Charadrius vociferus]|uniref:acetolactate synthase-like protein n=1 Tax=Charadrius vociferus TaxID=50402 RepID=UPI00052182BA|nr:PREDICTED: acetolactate synthase-like protein [Charadrius vociferus]
MDLLAGISVACAGLLAVLAAALLAAAYRLGLLYQLWHKVDPQSPRHGGELVAEVLKAHGVRFLFALAGGHISPILVASEKLGMIWKGTSWPEPSPAPMDGGFWGRIGVAARTGGPGVTNTVTAVKNAQMAESPVLLIGGAAATLQKMSNQPCPEPPAENRGAEGIPFPPPPTYTPPRFPAGRIGVAARTGGPGVTNTVTAVKNAQMAESPVLLIGGAAATLQKGRGALQDIDQLSLFKTLCKTCVSVRTVRDIVPALRQAIATAQSGTPGPVFVELPIDVLYPFHVVEKEIGGTKSGRGLRGKMVQWYLQNYIRNLFVGAWEPRDMSPLPVQVPLATDDEVQRCAELVSRATKPLVLVGSQAMLPPTPAEELRPYNALPRRPLAWLDPGAFGTLGVGGGFALGAKLCRPEAEVWVLYGDGSLGYSLMEFDTFVRHKTPVIALVGNDACWSQISREQVALLGSNVACGLDFRDHHMAMLCLVARALVVGRPARERLDAVLRAAQEACRQGRPVLINALIGKTDFRDGSISV